LTGTATVDGFRLDGMLLVPGRDRARDDDRGVHGPAPPATRLPVWVTENGTADAADAFRGEGPRFGLVALGNRVAGGEPHGDG